MDWIKLAHDRCSGAHGNEPSAFVKDGEFSDQLSDLKLFKKDPAPWS
jgi:hypothetical protein